MPESPEPAATDPDDPLVGQVLAGRYAITRRLGGGGMGSVYEAEHRGLRRKVAVKILHPHLTKDPSVAKRFDREAMAVSALDHRNCVRILDAGTSPDGTKYLVMERLDGGELTKHLGSALDPARAVTLSLQILEALDHAHRRGFVHRDLKPENIFVVHDDDGAEVVKLVDFGIVKLLESGENEERLTRAGFVFGTPRYMSPEQAAGGKIDARTDLYAVGVLMYEMLVGDVPFRAEEPSRLLRMHLLADPPALPPSLPEPLRAVVMKLLAKSPGDRFQSAREVADALRGDAAGRSAAAAVAPAPPPPGPIPAPAPAPPPPAARPSIPPASAAAPAPPPPAAGPMVAPAPPPPATGPIVAPAAPPPGTGPIVAPAPPPPGTGTMLAPTPAPPPPDASTSFDGLPPAAPAAAVTAAWGSSPGVHPTMHTASMSQSGSAPTLVASASMTGRAPVQRRSYGLIAVLVLLGFAGFVALAYMIDQSESRVPERDVTFPASVSVPADSADAAGDAAAAGTGDGEAATDALDELDAKAEREREKADAKAEREREKAEKKAQKKSGKKHKGKG